MVDFVQLLAPMQQLLQAVHPDAVPELIATPVVAGSEPYRVWLDEQLPHAG